MDIKDWHCWSLGGAMEQYAYGILEWKEMVFSQYPKVVTRTTCKVMYFIDRQ
jgi:hypothetical protein